MTKNSMWRKISDLIPGPPNYIINWDGIMETPVGSFLEKMKETEQNPVWHGEGNVFNHTRLVCRQLTSFAEYRNLPEDDRRIMFLSALLHDIGKIPTTRMEDGAWTSPNHSQVGAQMARELLWREFGLSGSDEAIDIRESICFLVRYHMIPVRILDEKKPEARLFKIASAGELAKAFTMRKLCLLSRADVTGRYANDLKESEEKVEMCVSLAAECDCLDHPRVFASDYTRRAYFMGKSVLPDQALYDNTWGEVIVMCGLPGTGKDTWIRKNYPDYPTVSLDDIRRKMGVKHTDDQGRIVQAANEQAREYLRKKQPFIWNATNLTRMTRDRIVRLIEGYYASVRIVYLETELDEQFKRNESREAVVPVNAVFRMLSNLSLPEAYEAAKVEWICV